VTRIAKNLEYRKCEERKGSDMRLLTQQITRLDRDLHDAQKNRKNKRTRLPTNDFPRLPRNHQRDATIQREIINRPDTSLLENDMPTDLARGRLLTTINYNDSP